MSTNPQTSKPYFLSIDGLRLLASVNIVCFHIESIGGFSAIGGPGWFFRIVKGPAFHASVFFILAGFIFTIKYSPVVREFSVRKFLLSRFKELYPLHAATFFAMAPLMLIPWILSAQPLWQLILSALVHLSMLYAFFPLIPFNFNTPSWALSAFFLCYLLLKPMLKLVARITKRRYIVAAVMVCCIPSMFWSLFYAATGARTDIYPLFHFFAPMRLFEFLLGILLARMYQINASERIIHPFWRKPATNDLIIGGTLLLLYLNLFLCDTPDHAIRFFAYHSLTLPLYAVLLYRLAIGNGFFSSLLALPLVRRLGKASFYPYLIHVPLVAWLCFILENYTGYNGFLHQPLNVAVFLVVLYSTSLLFLKNKTRKKLKAQQAATA